MALDIHLFISFFTYSASLNTLLFYFISGFSPHPFPFSLPHHSKVFSVLSYFFLHVPNRPPSIVQVSLIIFLNKSLFSILLAWKCCSKKWSHGRKRINLFHTDLLPPHYLTVCTFNAMFLHFHPFSYPFLFVAALFDTLPSITFSCGVFFLLAIATILTFSDFFLWLYSPPKKKKWVAYFILFGFIWLVE